MNPYDLPAAPFLALYFLLLLLAAGMASVWRMGLGAAPVALPEAPEPVGVAYLAGGRRRAADAAAVLLLEHGAATLQLEGQRLAPAAPQMRLSGVLNSFRVALQSPQAVSALPRVFRPALDAMLAGLRRQGLVRGAAEAYWLRLQSIVPLALLLVFGWVRLDHGVARGKPVGFLVMLMLITLVVIVATLAQTERLLTPAGRAVLAQLRRRCARVARAPMRHETALAVALVGVAALHGTAFAAYRAMRMQTAGGGSLCSGASGCGGDGSGCGGGGCGGCGG